MKKPGFDKGFSLVELLVVCGMVGLVMAAIFTLYQTHQRTAYTQEETVEVQQNLRIAMDSIAKDIKMAGFLTPLPQSATPPLSAAAANSITIRTASEAGIYTRINGSGTTAGVTTFNVDSSNGFTNGDIVVRIIRPQDAVQAGGDVTYSVTGTGAGALTLNTPAGVPYSNGDIIVRTKNNANNPNTVEYFVSNANPCPAGQWCIARRTDQGTAAQDTQIIANNICSAPPAALTCTTTGGAAGLQFSYLLDNGTETGAPLAAELSQIRAVRVAITGQTVTTQALSGGQAKERQVASVVMIRNRR